MAKEKGLSGIHETARGFVGSRPAPKFDSTRQGKSRIRFCIACGQNDEQQGKFPTWRFCVGYGAVVDKLRGLRVGNLVKASGWVSTEWETDEYSNPVQNERGVTRTRETLILYDAEVVEYEKKPELQPALIA